MLRLGLLLWSLLVSFELHAEFIAQPKDIALNKRQAQYYLDVWTLRLGLPGYERRPFVDDMPLLPKDRVSLIEELLAYGHSNAALKIAWQGEFLTIQVNPRLTRGLRYEDLLHAALNLIQRANNNRLPLVSGRALKAALQQKTGQPVAIAKRNSFADKTIK